MSFRPAKARYDVELEALKRHFRHLLRRDLSPKEEKWLEFSRPLLPFDEETETIPEVPRKTAA